MVASLSSVVFLLVLSIYLAISNVEGTESQGRPGRISKYDRWEQFVMRTVDKFSPGRVLAEGLGDETAHIQDIKSYYREEFDSSEGWIDVTSRSRAKIEAQSTDDADEKFSVRQKTIEGRYIVNLAQASTSQVLDRMVHILKKATRDTKQVLRADHIDTFLHAGKGFTATMNKNMVELVRSHPSIVNIEEDIAVHMKFFDYGELSSDLQSNAQFDKEGNEPVISSSRVPWNLDRIDQHSKVLDGQYNPEGTGKGVDIYIVDTGARYTHQDLEGRAKYFGVDMIDKQTGSNLKGYDCNGHGTHIAGTIGGKTYGVAKEVTMHIVRGLNCAGKGAVSGVVHAMNLIAKRKSPNPKVISLSVGIEKSNALNTALKSMNDKGITTVAAAGNQGSNSCNYSPASSGVSISVGATDSSDEIASFSNTGACVHLFAPGRDIVSIAHTCDTCTTMMSGTSMACPHVTGYVAIILGLDPTLTPAEVLQKVIQKSTKNALSTNFKTLKDTAATTPNRLLYVSGIRADDGDM